MRKRGPGRPILFKNLSEVKIYLPADMLKTCRKIAKKNRISFSEFIRKVITMGLNPVIIKMK